MKIEQNPFSFYDFLGYFIPGSFLLYLYYILTRFGPDSSLFESLGDFKFGTIEAYLPFVIIAYVLGHLQSFLSSITVEKYCLWCFDYPFKYLMDYPHHGYFARKHHKGWEVIFRVFLFIFLLPISLWDTFIGKVFGLSYLRERRFSIGLKSLVEEKFAAVVATIIPEGKLALDDPDAFIVMYHHALEHSNNHQQKFSNYVALYGFTRSVSFIFVILFWISLVLTFTYGISVGAVIVLFVVGFLAYLFYLSFCKFYRRFTLEVVMAFITR